MPRREDYELLWNRYQAEGVPAKISIERFCVSNGFTYREFEKWYKQRSVPSFAPIQVVDSPLSAPLLDTNPVVPVESSSIKNSSPIIKCIRIEFTDGTEIRNRGINLSVAMELLRKLSV